MNSYSGYVGELAEWWHQSIDREWASYRDEAMRILQAEDELKNIVKLVGPEALPDKQRLILETARIIRIAILQQNALDAVDTYCSPQKQFKMLKIVVDFHHLADTVVSKGLPISKITTLPVTEEIMRIKTGIPNDKLAQLDDLAKRMRESFEILETNMR
jgi:V/A-type H+-transporting ATPase subunit A